MNAHCTNVNCMARLPGIWILLNKGPSSSTIVTDRLVGSRLMRMPATGNHPIPRHIAGHRASIARPELMRSSIRFRIFLVLEASLRKSHSAH